MASKYAMLKGKVPKEPTERDIKLVSQMERHKGLTFTELAQLYNTTEAVIAKLTGKAKEVSVKLAALAALLEDHLEGQNADNITTQGRTWGISYEPYPTAEDPEAIVKYFNENGMASQLELTKSELAARLTNFVKEEAAANELIIEDKTIDTPDGPKEVREVRSKIPGVKVFLWSGLSKAKARVAK